MSLEIFKPGDKVTYLTEVKCERGMVKSLSDDRHVFVVYNCNDEWENYKNYTAARTSVEDLVKGWLLKEDEYQDLESQLDEEVKAKYGIS